MEVIAGILIILALYALIVYVIIPLVKFGVKAAGVIILIVLAISALVALVISIKSFFKALSDNRNPYKTYPDNHQNKPSGVKRNYFFGPGLHQIKTTVHDAMANIAEYRDALTAWKNNAITKTPLDILVYIGYGFAVFCTQVFGYIWASVFSVVLAVIIYTGEVLFFAFYTLLWIIDRLVLLFKSIHNRCPVCKRKSLIPYFVCPTCNTVHKNLVPSPYGVLHQKCSCGTKLATTFVGGRSKYNALCPYCENELYSSNSSQYGLQLVGGIGTGKTSFLAAAWHEYKNWLTHDKHISYQAIPDNAFQVLEEWFEYGIAEATTETNASMYSVIHQIGANTTVQMTIYDIAGEVFDYNTSDIQQQQFKYCEGYLLVIDPSASVDDNTSCIINFINAVREMSGKHAAKLSSVPVAIIITKSDLFKREVGLPKIQAAYKRSSKSTELQQSFVNYQHGACREFLISHGFENAVNMIEAEFSTYHYFPVSAMGHPMEDGEYQPWGVLAPLFWLMQSEKCPLKNLVNNQLN